MPKTKTMVDIIVMYAKDKPKDGQEYDEIKKQYRSADRKTKFALDTVFLALCGLSLNVIINSCEGDKHGS